MKRSIFAKLMTSYVIVIIISFSLVAVFLSAWFNSYYYDQKAASLIDQGTKLTQVVSDYINGFISKDKMETELLYVAKYSNTKIWIVDNYGYVQERTGSDDDKMLDKQLTNLDIDQIRKGSIVIIKGSSSEKLPTPMLTVGIPIYVNTQVRGGLFLHSPINEINKALSRVYQVIWISAIFATALSAFIIYYFSDRIFIRPIGKINQTARSISKGDFDKRVEIQSRDEIGDLAKSFNYMADSLKNLEGMRRSFIANISHELRSPITSINGFVSGMLDGTIPDEKWPHYLGIVHDETKRLIRLINDVLDLARLESGEFSLKMGNFDINELIRERIIKFEDRIDKKSVNVDVTLIDSKVMVKGDRDRIDQVLTNLLDNAIKFVPEKGTIRVNVELKQDRLIVEVYNNGTPIPKEDIKYIWDRFHKADKARSKGGGTGLGLSIARQIINQHNETIWVESGDFGTKFAFTLKRV
jgi:signal transduction histidine kinase